MSALGPNTARTARSSALPPSMTNSTPREASRPRSAKSATRRVQTALFSVVPSTTPKGTLVPSAATPSAPTSRCSPIPKPSRNTTSQRRSSSRRPSSSASRSAVACTNRRDPNRRPPRVRALLAAVPHRHPSRVVLALGAGQLGDLHVHQLGHDLQADRGRGGQQPLGHVRGEHGQVLVHPASHCGSPAVLAPTSRSGLESAAISSIEAAVWESCMRGPPPMDLVVPGASHVRCSGEDPTSNPTDLGATSDHPLHHELRLDSSRPVAQSRLASSTPLGGCG